MDYIQEEKLSRKMYIKIDYRSKQSICLDHCFLAVTLAVVAFLYNNMQLANLREILWEISTCSLY